MGSRKEASRGLAELVADFGGSLPQTPRRGQRKSGRDEREAEYELLRARAPRRGHARSGFGWSPVTAPLVAYRATTANVGGIWPLISSAGLPPTGALMGYDMLSGGGFYCDPIGWVLRNPPIVTNPNLIVFGKPGRGKSAAVKAFLLRMMRFGIRTLVAGDVKNEYEPLCRAVGVQPISLGLGLPARINPLDLGPLGQGWDTLNAADQRLRAAAVFQRWVILLKALIGARDVQVSQSDEWAISTVLADLTGWSHGASRLTPVTIPDVWKALSHPSDQLARDCRYASIQDMLDSTRQITDSLGALVTGTLAGLFDTHTTIELDWDAPIQSLSLRRLLSLGDDAVAVALTCLNSWSRGQTDLRRAGQITIVVRDEMWRQMRLGLGAVKSLDADLRLSRSDGEIQLVAAHKPSDMLSVGAAGSQEVAIAKDLMSLCDTKVLFGQDPNIANDLAELLDLQPMVRDWVAGWAMQDKGRAVWLVGDRVLKVQTQLSDVELPLFDTNNELRDDPASPVSSPPSASAAPLPGPSSAPPAPASAPPAALQEVGPMLGRPPAAHPAGVPQQWPAPSAGTPAGRGR
jgi:hypothetical protein